MSIRSTTSEIAPRSPHTWNRSTCGQSLIAKRATRKESIAHLHLQSDRTEDMHYFSPLTPTVFLERSGRAFPRAPAIRDDQQVISYAELLNRSRRLAAALRALGVHSG